MASISQMSPEEWAAYKKRTVQMLEADAFASMIFSRPEIEEEVDGDDYETHMRFECRQSRFV